ncbi:hypothetical protein BXY85_3070 [Roseivirga pacifica]|uniref:HTTM-like domain-containing protein n=1 Tax=Roseivirga pacifica TaxID=1267423 RepID=A0A1I0QW23_9BACT|nr:hypothetical protein BXY85_3070 [Roseivirga pacifica]SEW31937.1 hypothetical protein SAMN05216290_2803 [Roseivirga pacifica]
MSNIEAESTLELIAQIASIGIIINSFELINRRHLFQNNNLFSWVLINKLRPSLARKRSVNRLINFCISYPNILWLIGIRLLSAFVILFFQTEYWLVSIAIWFLYLSGILIFNIRVVVRTGYTVFLQVILVSISMQRLFPNSSTLEVACIWVIAIQCCLVYFENGLTKLKEVKWKQGAAIYNIIRNPLYKSPISRLSILEKSTFLKTVSWSVLIFETAFPISLLGGNASLIIFLGFGLVFHFTNSWILGLGSFFWTFVAAYPAIIFCNQWLINQF